MGFKLSVYNTRIVWQCEQSHLLEQLERHDSARDAGQPS